MEESDIVNLIYKSLRRNDINEAWAHIALLLPLAEKKEYRELAESIKNLVLNMTDVDPVLQEEFIGRVFCACEQVERGKVCFMRALRWKNLKNKAEKELGLDFNDYASLYHFLGATNFCQAKQDTREHIVGVRDQLLNENTVGFLFHAQQMEKILPILRHFSGAYWLTVGDGRNAFEARFLMRHGAKVLASNLDPTLLKHTKDLGLISEYAVEDVEHLSFPDKTFDFVCCKDTLHHCLAPWSALYEMMRVARKGIFLIEPFDHSFYESAIYGNRKEMPYHDFEKGPGNYVYSFSEREMEKLGVSRGWRCLAVRGMCKLEGHGIEHASTDPEDLRKQRERVDEFEEMARQGKANWVNLGVLLLREKPDPALRKDLQDTGFKVIDLVVNPYIKRDVLQKLDALYGN